jgi:uncharacterized alpha-E superfamily protein
MLSRIADSLFWLSRYMERSDGLLRSTRTNYILLLDKSINTNLSWKPVLEIFTYCNEDEINDLKDKTDLVLQKLISDTSNPNSLKVMVTKARENARGAQDLVTKEVWEHINHMYHYINAVNPSKQLNTDYTLSTIEKITKDNILYNGVSETTMPRGLGWCFMSLGKYIERCLLTIEVSNKYFEDIHYNLSEEKNILYWRPLLLSLSGYELHLKTYRSGNHNENVLHQILFNENFTRSVAYTLSRMERYFEKITSNSNNEEITAMSKHLGRLISKLKFTDFNSLNPVTLQPYISDVRKELLAFSNLFAKYFFSYA